MRIEAGCFQVQSHIAIIVAKDIAIIADISLKYFTIVNVAQHYLTSVS